MSLNDLANPGPPLLGTITTTKPLPIVVDISHSLTPIMATKAHISLHENVQAKGTKDFVNHVINKDTVPNVVLEFALLPLQLLLPITPLLPL
jgi:hypothetical protein